MLIKTETGYAYQKSTDTSVVDSLKSYSASIGVEKAFSISGTRLSVTHSLSYLTNKYGASATFFGYTPGAEQNLYYPTLTFSVTQPILLKNSFGFLDRLPIKIAKISEQIEKLNREETFERVITQSIATYLDWIYLTKQRIILRRIIRNNNSLLAQTSKKVKAGIAQISDLEVARINVIIFQNSLEEINNAYNNIFLQMKKYLPLSEDDTPDTSVLDQKIALEPNVSSTVRPLLILELLKKQLSLNLMGKNNSKLPDLNLISSLTYSGKKEGFGDSYSNIENSELYVGFSLSLPLSNHQAKADYTEIKAEFDKISKRREDTLKDVHIQIKSARNNIFTYERLKVKQNRYINSLARKLNDERKQYKRGILGLREISRTSNDLANARLQLTQYEVQHHKAYYHYLELVDILGKKYKHFDTVEK